jgi:uncharacterized protein (DUF1499 family)
MRLISVDWIACHEGEVTAMLPSTRTKPISRYRFLVVGGLLGMLSACSVGVPDTVGLRDGRLAPCPSSPNCVSSLATDDEHRVSAFMLAPGSEVSMDSLRQLVETLPRTEVVEVQEGAYLRAQSRSALFRFVDDLELHRRAEDRLEVRSASRVGYSDMGVNRKRVEQLRQLLYQRGLTVSAASVEIDTHSDTTK